MSKYITAISVENAITCGSLNASGNITAANMPLVASGTISSAQLLAGFDVNVITGVLNTLAVIDSVTLQYIRVGAVYTGGSSFNLGYGPGYSTHCWTSNVLDHTIVRQTSDNVSFSGGNTQKAAGTIQTTSGGLDIYFNMNPSVAVFAGGGGNLKYRINYHLVSL